MNNILHSRRGSALTIVLLVMVVTATLGSVVSMRSVNESVISRREVASTKAFWIAEAGIQQGVWEINFNDCQGLANLATSTACTSCSDCGSGQKVMTTTLSTGEYVTTIDQSATTVDSIGYYPSQSSPEGERAISVSLGGSALFGFAAFAKGQLVVNNNAIIDSYNSDDGSYGGSNVGDSGNIGTNGGTIDVITLANNAEVHGSISTGPGGTVSIDEHSVVTGGVAHNNNIPLSAVAVPSALTSATYGGTYSVPKKDTLTITGGDYKYDGITMGNNSILNIEGEVRIYLTGSVAMDILNNVDINITSDSSLIIYSDGTINISNNANVNVADETPTSFQIYSSSTDDNAVILENNGEMYAAIYAPDGGVAVQNNAGLFGAIVGDEVTILNNADLHYDQALGSISTPNSGNAEDWQEI